MLAPPPFIAALTELQAAGFLIVAQSGRFCIVALSSRWRT
jgi:hypothetical protein